jgi:thiol:disulfide interchange protein DsbC
MLRDRPSDILKGMAMRTTATETPLTMLCRMSLGILPAVAVAMVLLTPSRALSFGGGGEGCGAGTCSECHSFEKAEAETILSGIVDKVHSVEFAIVPGLWRVDAEAKGKRGVLYVDFSKSYAVSGRVLRLADWQDVTELRPAVTPKKADFSSIPLKDALVVGSREAPKKVVVFTDPKCPYCGKLHDELKKIVAERGDVAFYLKLFPLASHPESYGISKSIVCEQSLDYLEASFAGRPIPEPACETEEIDNNLKLVKELGIRSTPTLVLPDGTILPGFKPAGKIMEILDRSSSQP